MSNDKKKKSLFSSKKFRHGGFSVMMIAAVIVIVALLNVVISTMDSMWGLSYDLSSNKMYTISAQSKKVLSEVDEDVKIYALMQSGSESHTIEKLLDNYRKEAPDYIDITVVDPVQNPTFANQFTNETLSVNSVIVTNGDGSRYRVIDQYDMYEFGYTSSYQSYVKSFIGEDASIDFVTENGESFARVTALGDLPYIWSKSYPRSLQSAECAYIAVKYRLPKGAESDMGILYRNAYYPEYDLENVYTESIGGDDEWKVVIFYMFGEEKWQNWIVNIGLAPFMDVDSPAGKTIDIAFMKFYLQDPYDLYKELEYDPDKVVEDTEAPTETEAPKSGCGSTVAVGMVAVLALGAVLTLKKKED